MTQKVTRVLVADDNDDHLFFTTRALRDVYGPQVEVDTVSDGEEAIDYLERRGRYRAQPRPHLMLLDLKMPKVDGLQVLDHVKSDPELRVIPVIVLTSSDRTEDINATYSSGGNSYVTKPTNSSGLREGLRNVASYWIGQAQLPEPPS